MNITRTAFCLGAVFTIAACSGDKKTDPLAQDSSIARDLALANSDTAAQPQLKDVPAESPPPAPAPAATRPAPAPRQAPRQVTQRPTPPPPAPPPPVKAPPPAPKTTASGNTIESGSHGNSEGSIGVVSAGTTLALMSGQKVCTNTNSVGDRFTASLAEAVSGSNGAVIPAGATAVLEVTSLKKSSGAGDNMSVGVVVRSITYAGKTYPVNGEIVSAQTEKVRAANNNDAQKVLGGAAVGAVLGRIFSGKSKTKGTIIGAAGGAAAGAVLANQTADYDACIPSGGRISVKLNSAMQIQALGGSGAAPSGI